MFEVILFGGLASMIGGVCIATALMSHPTFVNLGIAMFGLGFLALIVTLR